VAADGGIFTFGDAGYFGSMGSIPLNSPVVGIAATPTGKGYWEVAADGGIFTFGDAVYYGSTGNRQLNASVAGMAATAKGDGYWLVGSDGAVYPFGRAKSFGSNAATVPTPPIVAMAATGDGGGYWMLDPEAFPTTFAHPTAPSSVASGSTIIQAAASQIGGDPNFAQGMFCNPYGPCEPWCALFATWAWEMAGIPIPRYPFTGSMYTWAAQHGALMGASSFPVRGAAVLYGTGPSSVATSVHVGIVAQVWPDGAIDTIDGDAGPGPNGLYNVIINGPFLPSQSAVYNGFPIYAYAMP
jgi:CHAP domain